MRCLVTGVAGFIGSSLAERLIAEGHGLTDGDRRSSQNLCPLCVKPCLVLVSPDVRLLLAVPGLARIKFDRLRVHTQGLVLVFQLA